MRSTFSKNGGNLGETGSVAFGFTQVGHISYPASAGDAESVFEAALEAGAIDVESSDDGHDIYCEPSDFAILRDAVEEQFGPPQDARIGWKPINTVSLDENSAGTMIKLLDALDDNDDVQAVFSNMDIDEAIMEKIMSA